MPRMASPPIDAIHPFTAPEADARRVALLDWAEAQDYLYWETFNSPPTHLSLPRESVAEGETLRRAIAAEPGASLAA